MIKKDEIDDFGSCLNKSSDNEMLFVLRAHDIVAPIIVRFWIELRILMKKNTSNDPQIVEALKCAEEMERQQIEGVNSNESE